MRMIHLRLFYALLLLFGSFSTSYIFARTAVVAESIAAQVKNTELAVEMVVSLTGLSRVKIRSMSNKELATLLSTHPEFGAEARVELLALLKEEQFEVAELRGGDDIVSPDVVEAAPARAAGVRQRVDAVFASLRARFGEGSEALPAGLVQSALASVRSASSKFNAHFIGPDARACMTNFPPDGVEAFLAPLVALKDIQNVAEAATALAMRRMRLFGEDMVVAMGKICKQAAVDSRCRLLGPPVAAGCS